MNAHWPARAGGTLIFDLIVGTRLKCSRHQLPVIRMRSVAERSKFLFRWQDMLLPRVKYARIMSFRPFRSSEWRPEGPPKHENSQLFAKKVAKIGIW